MWLQIRRAATALAVLACSAHAASATTIDLKSGNAVPTQTDPPITYLVEPAFQCRVAFPAAFTPADFAAADAGPLAWSVPAATPDWTVLLPCDTTAHWIAIDNGRSQRSALYSVPFDVNLPEPCCIQRATLELCWMADDALGDVPIYGGGPNPSGAYLNGVALPISGGGYTTQSTALADVTGALHCGRNRLYLYVRDAGCGVAGVIFHARITYQECITPATKTSWGRLRAAYR